ncbi:hypothetical protein [Namhaeicola litoreus]|uniref:WYL domain-containing protein n=1 Tax=Namhaeicola litoreus TaxID=1052145 RepID=A0ABW3Y0D0_9FLAO
MAVFLQLKKMPQNLNALIRYKQIDLCLRNPYLKATIDVLQKKCSAQLAEHRGVYKLVSERTIRDDIRVMRSNALGFDAPIVVSNGVYSYEDPKYSIFNTTVNDLDLLTTLTELLIKEQKNFKNPELLQLIERLKEMTGVEEEDMYKAVQKTELMEPILYQDKTDEVLESISFSLNEPYLSWGTFFEGLY